MRDERFHSYSTNQHKININNIIQRHDVTPHQLPLEAFNKRDKYY